MVLKDNVGFSITGFDWRYWRVVSGQLPTYTTGSDEDTPLLLVDYEGAWNAYGAPTKSGDCPHCGGLVNKELHFNPLSRYFFLMCPLTLDTYRYLNDKGNLDDLKIVQSSKKTEYDENVDVPNSGWF